MSKVRNPDGFKRQEKLAEYVREREREYDPDRTHSLTLGDLP